MAKHEGRGYSKGGGQGGRHSEGKAPGTQAQRDQQQSKSSTDDGPAQSGYSLGNRLKRPHHPNGWDSGR